MCSEFSLELSKLQKFKCVIFCHLMAVLIPTCFVCVSKGYDSWLLYSNEMFITCNFVFSDECPNSADDSDEDVITDYLVSREG